MELNNWSKDELRCWIGTIDLEPLRCEELSEDDIWQDAKTQIWQVRRFRGSPSFYPVYRWRDYYSYSPLTLLLKKGTFDLDEKVSQRIGTEGRNYLSSAGTLDQEIKRAGGPMTPKFRIRTPEQYAKAIAEAVQKDITWTETKHPNTTNVIMCGGKDSLNLLLLRWKNPVIVVSAAPNYVLVKQFIKDHGLPYNIIELKDEDTSLISQEILINFCRNNLEHCRWSPVLARIVRDHNGNVIFWKGQLGSVLMNTTWWQYTDPPGDDWIALRRACSLMRGRGEYRITEILRKSGITQRRTFNACWNRGAMWQGAHVSFLRQLTGALVLSAYHGPAMRQVAQDADLNGAVPYDIRPLIGEILYGKPVRYPQTNPGPKPSAIRRGVSDLKTFLEILKCAGIPASNEKEHHVNA